MPEYLVEHPGLWEAEQLLKRYAFDGIDCYWKNPVVKDMYE